MAAIPDSVVGGHLGLSKERALLLQLLREEEARKSSGIVRSIRAAGERLPLSWSQQRLWFIDQLEGGAAGYQVPIVLRLRGPLDVSALQRALDTVVLRHESLRTVFSTLEGEPVQTIRPARPFPLRIVDVSDDAEPEARLRENKSEEVQGRFDLASGPLIRGRLVRLGAEEHVLLLTMHHIVFDGWSKGVLIGELTALYRAYHRGAESPLEALPVQYSDYAYWQRGRWEKDEGLRRQLDYWREQLQGVTPQLDLPTDRPRPAVQTYRGENVTLNLGTALTARLNALAQRHEMTLFMVLYAGLAVLLSRLSGQEEVTIGSPVANRQRAELERLIGLFVNPMVLRVGVPGELEVTEFLRRVKATTLGAYDHQDVPLEKIVEALQPQRSLSRGPLFQAVFVLHNWPRSLMQWPDVSVSLDEEVDEPAILDFWMALEERNGEVLGAVNYAADLFDRSTIERWMECFRVLLAALADGTCTRISELPILPAWEEQQVTQHFNDTRSAYPRGRSIHGLIEEQARRVPDAVALRFAHTAMSYDELNARANQLAHHLRDHGVGPDSLVGIYLERNPEMVVGLLGILKAGGAYIPLDPSYPLERIEYMLEDAAPLVLLTQADLLPRLTARSSMQVVCVDRDAHLISRQDADDLDPEEVGFHAGQLAYVIYTSGSTGRPKGVMVQHVGVVNFLHSMQHSPGMSASDRVLAVTTISFDIAGLEIYLPLIAGAEVILATREDAADAHRLIHLIEQSGVTVLQATPVTWRMLLGAGWRGAPGLKALCGGEALATDLSHELVDRVGTLWNVYGPTETTIWSCAHRIVSASEQAAAESIGRPIANTQVYVLDTTRRPVPIGVAGELFIGGEGVARGYLNRPQLTAERFVADPFDPAPGARLYRTGDLARWRPDGTLEYLGRNDFQVKIRGFRIELGEIEAQLARFPHVRDAVVVAREDSPGEKRLVAYLTPRDAARDDSTLLNAEALRTHLKSAMPDYMVPSAFVVLESLPLTSNGKIDRRALPAPGVDDYAHREYEAPAGSEEEALAAIWQALLRLERVSRRDNFFELGGHSLLIVQMIDRLRAIGLATDMRRVFESATLADLAATLTVAAPVSSTQAAPLLQLDREQVVRIESCVPGGAANVQDIYPLTPVQEGLLFHHLLDRGGGDLYVIPMVLSVSSRQRLEELIAALQSVVDRHDALRTSVLWESLPRPVQVVWREARLPVEELTLDRDRDALEQIEERISPACLRIELQRAPLVALEIMQDTRHERWFAILKVHHIVSDAASLRILISEVVAHLEGSQSSLPDPTPYRDHVSAVYARSSADGATAFFRSRLADVEEPSAPFGFEATLGSDAGFDEVTEEIGPALAQEIRRQARRYGVSVATFFHAAWGLVVARTSNSRNVVFGSVLLGRMASDAATKNTVGMFINTLPLRLALERLTARQLIETTQRELIELLGHEQASLADAQRCSGVDGSRPLFTSVLNYRHEIDDRKAHWASAAGIRVLTSTERTNYPIAVSVDDCSSRFLLSAQTDRRIPAQRIVAFLRTAVTSLVEALGADSQVAAEDLTVLPAEERERLRAFNQTAAPFPEHSLVHELFEEQAASSPNAVAVECEGERISYADLDERARRLARHLKARGVGPDRIVTLYLERGVDLVVSVVAVLKAGGACMPLDVSHPAERLAFMLNDSKPVVVLTQARLRARLPHTDVPILAIDALPPAPATGPDAATEAHTTPPHLAYILYTSGSTGLPKGVMLEHRGLVNLLHWQRSTFDLKRGRRCACLAGVGFDASAWEIWQALASGATLVVAPPAATRDGGSIIEWWARQRIDISFLSTPVAELAFSKDIRHPTLTSLLVGGDRLRQRPPVGSCALVNNYGPTETTVIVTSGLIREHDRVLHIGRPLANVQIHILDRARRRVPIGVEGEIYIGGVGVARGYLNRPELTAERFVPDPFGDAPGARLYRTGDMAKWRDDGTIEYVGRSDFQVKMRGLRLELGEIEARLLQDPRVKEAVVLAREDGAGEKRLVAYLGTGEGQGTLIADLREHLKRHLPDYMVPSAWVVLDHLPLTPNGKIDRRALPEPHDRSTEVLGEYRAPRSASERSLAAIWAELLGIDQVGVGDNFFELGGHSLHGMKLVAIVAERLGARLPVTAAFEYPTIEQMALRVESILEEDSNSVQFEEGVLEPERS
jgi:amino acid adenylation domain-containing protein